MDFLNQKEGGIVFPTFSFTETEFEEIEISWQSWRGNCE
jgi:hypothetical protein